MKKSQTAFSEIQKIIAAIIAFFLASIIATSCSADSKTSRSPSKKRKL
jgi:hypothetical protein